MTKTKPVETLGEALRHFALTQGSTPALTFEGRTQTFAELDRASDQVANALEAMDLKPGTRIAHLGKNSDLFFELLYGAGKAGLVLAPVNWRLADPEILAILKDCEATVLFTGPEFAERTERFAGDLPALRDIIALESDGSGRELFSRWRDRYPDKRPAADVTGNDIALQLYTSGTTGRPKGVMLSHKALMISAQRDGPSRAPWQCWEPDDVCLIAMPNFHIAGAGLGLMTLNNGAHGVVAREFSPEAVFDGIAQKDATRVFMVPAAMHLVLRHPRARTIDYSRLRYISYGASPIPLELLREAIDVFGCQFVQNYGMTETCGTFVALPPEDHSPEGSKRMRSAGTAIPGAEVAIMDETGRFLPPDQIGEIVGRWPGNMAGYWKLEAETRKTIDARGWLHTGDAGYMDKDGYVYVQDRIKDVIISGGENIYPTEVENAIFGYPAVEDVAVIGVPDPQWGEAVKAIVVVKSGHSVTPDEIMVWARTRIARYKVPKSIDFIEALPRNPSGKILRRELREPYWAGLQRRVN